MTHSKSTTTVKCTGLVSIIIPTKNRSAYLKECLESVLSQTYKNIEIIVIDDHSIDETADTVSFLRKQHKNILYFINPGHGACSARNKGIKEASGEFIAFIDDDDWVASGFISKRIYLMAEDSSLDFVSCNIGGKNDKDGDLKYSIEIHNLPHNIIGHLLSSISTPMILFRKSSLIKLGEWDETCLRNQDIRYYHRIFLYKLKGYFSPEILYFIRIHVANMSSKRDLDTISSASKVFEDIYKEWKQANMAFPLLGCLCIHRAIAMILFFKEPPLFWKLKKILRISIKYPKEFAGYLKYIYYKTFHKVDSLKYYLSINKSQNGL